MRGNAITRPKSLLRRDEGQDTVEYGLLAAFISISALLAIKAIGPLVNTLYESVKTAIAP
jgi:Flp pilus assembly pilin Flp